MSILVQPCHLLAKAEWGSTSPNTPTRTRRPLVFGYLKVLGYLGTAWGSGAASLRCSAPPTLPSPRLGSGNVVSGNR